jgi:hypothetical protein
MTDGISVLTGSGLATPTTIPPAPAQPRGRSP